MTWQRPPRYTSTLTRKQKEAAFNAQAPLDAPPRVLAKPKREKRGDDELPDFDGIGGTDK